MKRAIKNFFNHPLMAPITDTLRDTFTLPARGIKGLRDNFTTGYNNAIKKGDGVGTAFFKGYGSAENEDAVGLIIGAAICGGIGGMCAGILATLESTSVLFSFGAGFGGFASGVLLTPVTALIGTAVIGTAIGVFTGGVPGFINGCEKALTFAIKGKSGYAAIAQARALKKNPQAQAPTAPAATPPPDPSRGLIEEIGALSVQDRQKLIREINESFSADFDAVRRKQTDEIDPRTKEKTQTPAVPILKKMPFQPGKQR